MFSFNSSFIGYPKSLRYTKFHAKSDSQQKFNKSLSELGPEWLYANTEIDYVRNSWGHRSPELQDINLHNYILCTGCSLIEGVGLPVEARLSDVLASMLGCDMYNIGLGGTSNDIIFYNLMTWFKTVEQKPKIVVIRWTDNTRFMTINGNMVNVNGVWDDTEHDFIAHGNSNGYFDSKINMFRRIIKSIIDVPVIEIPWRGTKLDSGHIVEAEFDGLDLARDLMHPGIRANKMNAQILFDYIKKVELL
jgi:hypothetical protein